MENQKPQKPMTTGPLTGVRAPTIAPDQPGPEDEFSLSKS
jgi:hypothetical protein